MNSFGSDIHALSGAYAVDALNETERASFEAHLELCPACRDEVAELREATAALTELTATPPPLALRESVLADITRVRPLPPVVPEQSRPRRRWLPALAAAAAVLTVLGAGVAITQPWQDSTTQVDDPAQRVLAAGDARSVTLNFPDGARATLTQSRSVGRAVLVTEAMPAAPDGQVYQLWLQTPDEDMVSAGLMPPESDQTVVLEGDASEAIGAGITVEPEGGSPEPTSDPIALFDLRDEGSKAMSAALVLPRST